MCEVHIRWWCLYFQHDNIDNAWLNSSCLAAVEVVETFLSSYKQLWEHWQNRGQHPESIGRTVVSTQRAMAGQWHARWELWRDCGMHADSVGRTMASMVACQLHGHVTEPPSRWGFHQLTRTLRWSQPKMSARKCSAQHNIYIINWVPMICTMTNNFVNSPCHDIGL